MVFKGTERRSAEISPAKWIPSRHAGRFHLQGAESAQRQGARRAPAHRLRCSRRPRLRPKLDSDDVNKERQVVLEEIKMDLDNPEYLLHDIFTRGFWPEHSLGRPYPRALQNVAQF